MTAPFAAIEARINAAAFAHVANATADFGAGHTANGIFSNGYTESFGLMSGSKPSISLPDASVATVSIGAALTIGPVAYVVAEKQADGAGSVLLVLETA